MLPTMEVSGKWAFTSKLHARGKGVVVGDVISYIRPFAPGTHAIKRVIGMPGDFVIRDSPDGSGDEMLQV